MIFHYIVYGLYLIFLSNAFHYLYTVAVLVVVEFAFLYFVNKKNQASGAVRWEQTDVGAVDMTPWKYRMPVSVVVTLVVVVVYVAFSPLGFGTW